MTCFLAQFAPDTPCDGRLVKCHLVRQQVIRRELGPALREKVQNEHEGTWPAAVKAADRAIDRLLWDDRTWVWGCGGILGSDGHHGMLDHSRTLRIPRAALPVGVEEFCAEHGLTFWLEREYGPLEAAA